MKENQSESGPDHSGGDGGGDKAREAMEHLQAAAFEVIAALRSFLDLAEDLVRDPAQAAGLAARVA
ncbi:MAG: hypothetical protein M3P34_01555, partial [Actinomycetota bacterium]|nr:hypothetical protein [Actinomycetota bacterium]